MVNSGQGTGWGAGLSLCALQSYVSLEPRMASNKNAVNIILTLFVQLKNKSDSTKEFDGMMVTQIYTCKKNKSITYMLIKKN